MQGFIARVCVVVTAAILNHPLLFPQENATLPDQDAELMARMREHEERLELEQARLEEEVSRLELEQGEAKQEEGYGCYLWGTVYFVVFFTIKMCGAEFSEADARPADDEDAFLEGGSVDPAAVALDKDTLSHFCDKCAHGSAHEIGRLREFAEGFADDLLEALRSEREPDMEVGDFVGVGSMFESWKACRPLTCDLLVPLSPPHPFCFQSGLWCGPGGGDMGPDVQGCGVVKLTRLGEAAGGGGCPCVSAGLGEDVLCLLHGKGDELAGGRHPDELLCSENTAHLAKDRVMKWFQVSITRAWGRISHKYDFEVTFRDLDAAGALKIRFRSGKAVALNMIPVVQLEDTDAYFVSHFPSDCGAPPDPYWPLSLAVYERNLLKHVAKRLPPDSCHLHCLRVATFLHGKQTALTGKSALTSYHWKTALLHLLLAERPPAWGGESAERRLRDLLGFMQRSLREKRLHHALIGNGRVPEEIRVPQPVRQAEPVNLFRPLVLQRELHQATVRHLQEMLRNSAALLQEYTPFLSNGGVERGLEDRLCS